MDVKGAIESVRSTKEGKLIVVKDGRNTFRVIADKEYDFRPGIGVSFINVKEEKHFLGTTYKVTPESIVSTYTNVPVLYEDLRYAHFCEYALIFSFFDVRKERKENKEVMFYNGAKGKFQGNRIAEFANRYPKELRGKFSYRPVMFSEKSGVLLRSILHFGKFPVVFDGDETKGILVALEENKNKFVTLDEASGKMKEHSVTPKAVSEVMSRKNAFARKLFSPDLKEFWQKDIENDCYFECPLKEFCRKVHRDGKKREEFERYFVDAAKDALKYRSLLLKTIKNGENPLRLSTRVVLKEKADEPDRSVYKLGILSNEAAIKSGEDFLVSEKPPLERRVFAKSKSVSFREIIAESAEGILSPEKVSPLPQAGTHLYKGLFQYLYSNVFSDESIRSAQVKVGEDKHFTDDKEQNEAINKLLGFSTAFCLKGEYGTGKKFVLRKAFQELLQRGNTVSIAAESRKEEAEQFFRETLSPWFEKGKISVYSVNDPALYGRKGLFDYVAFLSNGTADEKVVKSVMGLSKNFILSSPGDCEFLESLLPKSSKTILKTEHRFGAHILHFLQPVLSDKLFQSDDKEFKVLNKENISPQFIEVVNPEKYVQEIYVKGHHRGINNQWNVEEASFIVEAVKEFVKAGIERKNIGVVVPYERQKALLDSLLLNSKIPDILVSEPQSAVEKDVIFISFTNTKKVGGDFVDDAMLKSALTRARCKLLLVGQKGIYKSSKVLSKLL